MFLKIRFFSLKLRLHQKEENKEENSQYSYSTCAELGRRGNNSVHREFEP